MSRIGFFLCGMGLESDIAAILNDHRNFVPFRTLDEEEEGLTYAVEYNLDKVAEILLRIQRFRITLTNIDFGSGSPISTTLDAYAYGDEEGSDVNNELDIVRYWVDYIESENGSFSVAQQALDLFNLSFELDFSSPVYLPEGKIFKPFLNLSFLDSDGDKGLSTDPSLGGEISSVVCTVFGSPVILYNTEDPGPATGTITVEPYGSQAYWPYVNAAGEDIYDVATGEPLVDPIPYDM